MTIQSEGNTDTIDMTLVSVKQTGPDGEFTGFPTSAASEVAAASSLASAPKRPSRPTSFIGEDWVPQEEVEIGLLEALNDELVRDAWV